MKNKFCTLLACLLLLNTAAYAEGTPEKFKNPIFNDILWTANKNSAHDMKITPTFIDEIGYSYDSNCSFLVEDDKAIFLECHPLDLIPKTTYEFFFARYQFFEECNVWQCSFIIKNGIIEPMGMGTGALLTSKIYNCQDEENYLDFPDNFKLNCMEELKARGWQKYIPGKLPNEK